MLTGKKNILVFIHGMVTADSPTSHQDQYERFFRKLCEHRPELKDAFAAQVSVEWGHQIPSREPQQPDERLTKAQRAVHSLVNYRAVARNKGPNNKVIWDWPFLLFCPPLSWLLRHAVFRQIKEETLLFGLADAVYYCSSDGEAAVRKAVYGQVLEKLRPFEGENVTLHIVAQSLGCTVAFDFLYGLFAPSCKWGKAGRPDFASDSDWGQTYMTWRGKREKNQLHMGSMASMASQLPLLLLRRQPVVDALYSGKKLDPTVIGIAVDDPKVRWQIFYDVDDLLSFPTRNLFGDSASIADIQADTADRPDRAHGGYWTNTRVAREVAQLLAATV